jgi:hypothetical protein
MFLSVLADVTAKMVMLGLNELKLEFVKRTFFHNNLNRERGDGH